MMSETRLPAFDLPDEFNALAIDEREYIVAEVGFIDSTLAPILSGNASGARYSDRTIRALFRRNPSQEGKVPCSNDGR